MTAKEFRSKIFKEIDDHYDWNKYIEYFKLHPEMDEDRKAEFIHIYSFMKQALGRDYLKRCYPDGKNLANYWLYNREHFYTQLKWLQESLEFFKETPSNYEKIRSKLKSNKNCNVEGIPFLMAGDSLRKSGFEVDFEPDVPFRKKPDIKIKSPDSGEIIYVEISRLNDSADTEEKSYTYHNIMNIFVRELYHIPFSGKIFRIIDKEELSKLRLVIHNAKQKAVNENSLVVVTAKDSFGILEFAVAHIDKHEDLKTWQERKKYDMNNVRSLPINFNENQRVIQKITQEATQLPLDFPGIIYAPVNPWYLSMGLIDYDEIRLTLKEHLKVFPHILGVCLYSHIGNESEEFSFFNFDYYERKIVHNNIQQDLLFISNHYCQIKTYPDTLLRVYNSFQSFFR